MAEYMTPWEIAAYQNRTDQAGTAYQNSLAQDTFSRSMADVYFQRNSDRLGQQFDKSRSQLPGSFARRGLLNSGIYQQALTDYANSRQQAFGDLNFDYSNQKGQLDVNKQGFTNTYNTSLTGVEAEKAARRAELATQLRGIM